MTTNETQDTVAVIGYDPGFGNTKVRIDGRVGMIQSAVSRPKSIGLATIGMRAAAYQVPNARRLLDRLLQAAEAGGRTGSVIEVLLLQALTHQAQGNAPSALASLECALTLAKPEGYVQLFTDEGEPLRMLIADFRLLIEKRKHGESQKLIGYVNKLLAAFLQPVIKSQSALSTPQSSLVEPLSDRELEVLRLLGTELSGPEIARQLTVSLNTVRTHTKNIYSKLGVNNRRAAIRRAEELGLR